MLLVSLVGKEDNPPKSEEEENNH